MALVTGGAAGICGLVSLFKRRWLAALVSIAAPLVAFAALLIAACLS